ncbi:MAG: glycosyltransferase family 2 protein [Gemmatimonadota bacterium]
MTSEATALAPGRQPVPASSFAVIIPAFDEAENMPDLFREMAQAFERSGLAGEIILVDDGSTDGTLEAAQAAARLTGLDRIRLLRHERNRGKTAALMTAVRATDADVFVLFDADLQHSPDEIPRFLTALGEGADLVSGRKVGQYQKPNVSRVYNWLARAIFHVPVRDMNSMKAFHRRVLDGVHLRRDWHRYLVVLAHASGHTVSEIDIELFPRRHGISKYSGQGRILIGILDLVSVWFQVVFGRKPMLLFGLPGLGLIGVGGLVGLIALYLRFVAGAGYRPLLTLVVLLVLLGMLLFVAGFVAELVTGLRAEVEELRREVRE